MAAPIPFLRPQLPSLDEIRGYYRLAEEARHYTNGGPCERLLRERLSDYLGGVGVIPVNNATSGIIVALRAVLDASGTGERPFVVTPSYTFPATAGAIAVLGHRPLFVDVEPAGWQVDGDALADVLARRHGEIAAVLGTHTFGVPPPVAEQKRWQEVCREHGVPLVVDAAAGFGAEDDTGARTGRSEATHVFSFHATKPFGIGEGGAITTLDDDLLARCNAIREFGFGKGKLATSVGINAKLDELHAATALALLDRYGDVLRRRREIVARYRERLEPHGFALQSGHEGGTWQAGYLVAPDAPTRSAVVAAASAASVGVVSGYYDTPLHRHPVFADAEVHGDLAVTEDLAARALALPMANDLTDDEVDRVVDIVLGGRRSA